MNYLRFGSCALAGFILLFGFDFIWHGQILADLYAQTASLWRSPEEMQQYFHWVLVAHIILATILAFLYIKYAPDYTTKSSFKMGMVVGASLGALQIGVYPYQPLSETLVGGWFLGTFIEITLIFILFSFIYKE